MKANEIQKMFNKEYCKRLQRRCDLSSMQPLYDEMNKLRIEEGLNRLILPNLEKHFKLN